MTTSPKKRGRFADALLPPLDPAADLYAVVYRTRARDRAETFETREDADARAQQIAANRDIAAFVFGPPAAIYQAKTVDLRQQGPA